MNNQRAAHSHGSVILRENTPIICFDIDHSYHSWLMGRYCPWFFNTANEKNSNEDRDEIGGIFTFKNYPLREESSFWVYFTWIFWCTVSCWAISCVQNNSNWKEIFSWVQARRLWQLFILLLLFCCWLNFPCSDPAPPGSVLFCKLVVHDQFLPATAALKNGVCRLALISEIHPG